MSEDVSSSGSSRLLWGSVGVCIFTCATFGGIWILLANGLRDLALEWIDSQRAQGWSIASEDPVTQGFPSWPEIRFNNMSVIAPLEDGGWSWQTQALTLSPATFDLTSLTLRAPGIHLISTPAATNGPWTVEAGELDFALNLDTKGKWQGADLDMNDVEVRDSFERPWAGAQRFDADLQLNGNTATFDEVFANFTSAADNIRFGVRLGPFDRTVRALRLDADLVGPITPGRLSEALEAWRSGGGTLEVRRFMLDWPPLAIAGDGTIALDDRLQPIAAFSTRITGFNETLESLEETGVLPRGQAATGQVILSLLASTPRGGDEPELAVPVSVQDQRVSVGPFDLMDVPEVRWE